MQSENFDNKIRQAAEQHHPEYDGKAWTKMEKMLDKHLPQKDDRRRRAILFILLFLLLGGGTLLLINKPWQPSDRTLTTSEALPNGVAKNSNVLSKGNETSPDVSNTEKAADKRNLPETTIENPSKDIGDKKDVITTPQEVVKQEQAVTSNVNTTPLIQRRVVNKKVVSDASLPVADKRSPSSKNQSAGSGVVVNQNERPEKASDVSSSTIGNDIVQQKVELKKSETAANSPTPETVDESKVDESKKNEVKEKQKPEVQKKVAQKNNGKKKKTLFVSAGIGPDISWVRINRTGELKLLTGLGIGYTFKNRFTIRSGFYSSRKVYSAKRNEYKQPEYATNWQNVVNIDANCKVYEIPLNLSYNFSPAHKNHVFASAGLSSFIMKKEQYVYLYKNPSGSTYSYTKTLDDANRHFFSVLNISAGYQHSFSRHISMAAEPYVKLPLAGVGYGEVKLASAGVLFSLNYNLYQSSSRK